MKQSNLNNDHSNQKKITSKQILAIIGILLLIALYIIALVAAITDNSASGRLFMMCLFATIAVPILIWVYTWMYGKLTNKHTFADFDIEKKAESDEDSAQNPE